MQHSSTVRGVFQQSRAVAGWVDEGGQLEAAALFILLSQTRGVCRFTSRMNNTFAKLQLHFVAINIIMRPLHLSPQTLFPSLHLSLSPGQSK